MGRWKEGGGGLGFPHLFSCLAPCAGCLGQRRVWDPKKGNPCGPRLCTGELCTPAGSRVPPVWTPLIFSEHPCPRVLMTLRLLVLASAYR